MEMTDSWNELLMSFGILWELLPYYGNYRSWKNIMRKLWKQTKEVWDKNQSAFKQLSLRARVGVITHDWDLSPQFLDYITETDVLMNYKIAIDFCKEETFAEIIDKFREFLEKLRNKSIIPIYHSLSLPFNSSGKEILRIIKSFDKSIWNQQNIFHNWKIISSKFDFSKLFKPLLNIIF